MAAKTGRVRLGTSVINAPLHVPVVLARRFATLDQLSGGRVIAGLGQGWMAQEFRTANIPMQRRGAGMDKCIAAMRAAWGPNPVRFDGRFYTIPPSEINPKPVQPGGPPILLGPTSPAGLERAARIADGINPLGLSYEMLAGTVQRFRAAAQAIGLDPAALLVMVRVNTPIAPAPLPEDQRPLLSGPAAQIAEDIARITPLDIDHIFFATGASSSLEEVQLMEELQTEVRSLRLTVV